MLSQLLYNQPELRPPVLKALRVIVEGNTQPSEEADDPEAVSDEEAAQNLAFLRSQAESWFAVLFNVFGTVGRNEQGMVGDVISTWAAIADEKVAFLSLFTNMIFTEKLYRKYTRLAERLSTCSRPTLQVFQVV